MSDKRKPLKKKKETEKTPMTAQPLSVAPASAPPRPNK